MDSVSIAKGHLGWSVGFASWIGGVSILGRRDQGGVKQALAVCSRQMTELLQIAATVLQCI
jgi:hypothetical protein